MKKNEFIDPAHINQIFIGFKDSVEIISECRFFVDGNLIHEYHQNEMIRESYAYNSIRSRDAKICSPKSHSLWENVSTMSPNVCGVYLPLEEFLSEKKEDGSYDRKFVNVKLELIIPFTDQLVLQAWRLYPNRILGEMEEEIITSLDGLVWCQLQPKIIGKLQKKLFYDSIYEYKAPDLLLNNCFSQINDFGKVVCQIQYDSKYNSFENATMFQCESSLTNIKTGRHYVLNYEIQRNKLILNHSFKPKINVARTNLCGFGIKPEVTEGLLNSLQQPIIVPAQELSRYIFEQTVTEREINLRRFVPLRNSTNITMMFPRTNNQCTVFTNIMHENVQLIIDKRLYPHTAFENTWNGRFIQYQLQANELDGCEATKEYLESISRPYIDHKNFSFNIFSCPYDNTDFGINFQLERGNAGYVFDGLDTDTRDVEVKFYGRSIFSEEKMKETGHNILNTYYYPNHDIITGNPDFNSHPPHPEMWICSDTYWTWSIENGVQYHKDGIPNGYE